MEEEEFVITPSMWGIIIGLAVCIAVCLGLIVAFLMIAKKRYAARRNILVHARPTTSTRLSGVYVPRSPSYSPSLPPIRNSD
jgi:hypothetical protein